jgi:hypothetical protein
MGLEARDRDYEAEARAAVLQAEPAAEDPLQAAAAAPAAAKDEPRAPAGEPHSAPAAAPSVALDPLTAALQSVELDPLGAAGGGPLAVDHNPIGVKAPKQREQRRGACPGQALTAVSRVLTPRRAAAQTTRRLWGRCLRTQRRRRSGTPRSRTS